MSFDVVIPSCGRSSLGRLLSALLAGEGPAPGRIIVVDDRRRPGPPLAVPAGVAVVSGPGRGPAAARNVGWRAARAGWVAFLDDDVIPPRGWRSALAADLAGLGAEVAASQGGVVVPLPADRRPTDWERNVNGLERARWATADMAFRRAALEFVGGFDERFRRAYREDADLALRLMDGGLTLARGRRHVVHPVGPADAWVSVRLQAGNADDVLMAARHGRRWRERAGAPRGRLRAHLLATGALAAGALVPNRPARALLLAGWGAATAELAWARIAPGPRSPDEIARMTLTSILLPPVAMWQHVRGRLRLRRLLAAGGPPGSPAALPPLAVLLDRDDTLIEDVPYNGDPERVRPLPGVAEALDALRRAGLPLAVVSNQSAVGRGLIDARQVAAVNARVQELLGPFEEWLICPHAPDAGCPCRKPAPGLILEAARRLDVPPSRCVMIGDIGADVEAAQAAGARGILVPTARTRPEEVAAAPERATTFGAAVDRLLAGPTVEEPLAA